MASALLCNASMALRIPIWARRLRPIAGAGVVLVLFALAVGALFHIVAGHGVRDIVDAARALPPARLGASVGLSIAAYLVFGLYDRLALRVIGRPLPHAIVAPTAFIA